MCHLLHQRLSLLHINSSVKGFKNSYRSNSSPREIETGRKANGGREIHIFPHPEEITATDIIFVFARRGTVARVRP